MKTRPSSRFAGEHFLLGAYGVATAIVARGLWKKRASVALWAAIVCVTWMLIGLLPFGAYGLYALLRPQVSQSWT